MGKIFHSGLTSLHHYYVVFFEAKELTSPLEIFKLFHVSKNKETNPTKDGSGSVLHFQLELPKAFGSLSILSTNKATEIDNVQNYWYDFYAGEIIISKRKFFYISYPYVKLGKYIESHLSSNRIRRVLYKPQMTSVMDFMKLHDGQYVHKSFKADIIKYTASIMEDNNANKINILGRNPLKSSVYKLLSEAQNIAFETTSLKMQCFDKDTGSLELAFDRLGNYRFWVGYEKDIEVYSTLPSVFRFLYRENLLEEDTFFNSFTLLEGDKD